MEYKYFKTKYLTDVKNALEQLYINDRTLLNKKRRTHEQTITFRIAHYLSNKLEDREGYYIDCEYHGDINKDRGRKELPLDDNEKPRKIRPDIIYHNRYQENIFAIEAKLQGISDADCKKIRALINERDYNYTEGFCIYNIGFNYVTVNVFLSGFKNKGIKIRYKFNPDEKELEKDYIKSNEGEDVDIDEVHGL